MTRELNGMTKSDLVTTTSFQSESSQEILVPRHCTLTGFTEATSQQNGVHVGSLNPLTRLAVTTRNTEYTITIVEPKDWKVMVVGGRFFPTERLAFLCGSGYGGTLLKVAWLGVGLCCELSSEGQRVVTSPVQNYQVLTNALPGPF
jgi:hypothetical protein